jgi:poly(glycerol-phosphate) alpha-glucosyltransferase
MGLSIGIVVGSTSRLAGGLFTSVRRSAQVLAEQGCAVTVYGLRDRFSEADRAPWGAIEPVLFDTRGPAALGFAPALAGAIGDHDVLHQHGIWQYTSRAVSSWRQRTGRPVMISPRGMLDPWALANSGWKKRLAHALFERENLARATCLHALAPAEAHAMRAFGLDNPIALIPNGMDFPQEAVARPAETDDRRTLFYLGRIHPKKGLDELLEAWGIVARARPSLASGWRLVIAGWDDGGHLERLQRKAEALPAGAQVTFPGPLHGEQKDRALRSADAFILPSYSEGLPMSVLEAWAHGVPVLMTDECNLTQAFAAGAAIRISNRPAELAASLEHRLADPALAAVGETGRSFCAAHFTWSSIAARHIETYDWMLDRAPRPGLVIGPGEPVPEA